MLARFKDISPRWQSIAPYLFLIGAVFATYANVYGNGFLFDDDLLISLNQYLRSWDHLGDLLIGSTTAGAHIAGGFYRPVQILLYFITFQLFGESTTAFHFLNITIHAANACLVYTLGRRLAFNPTATLLATLIWAVHPIHTEAVTYMSGTADPLYVLFCLIGLNILLPDFAPRKIFMAAPLMMLALLSKETAVIFPLLVICCMALVSPNRLSPKLYVRTWPLFLIAALFSLWRVTNTDFDGPASYARMYANPGFQNMKIYAENWSYRSFTFLATLPNYAALLVWPEGLHMERAFKIFPVLFSTEVLLGLVMLLAVAGQIIWGLGRRGLALSWGCLWFIAAHLPNTGLLVATNSLFLEHWMYAPTIGLFLGIGQTISTILRTNIAKKTAIVLTLFVGMALAIRTLDQNEVWEGPISFYTNVFKYGENTARSHNNLALAYAKRGDYVQAIAEFHKAIDTSDTYAETRHNLAITLLNLPDQSAHIDEALANLHRALEIEPHFYRSYLLLAQIYEHQGDTEKAEQNRKQAEEIMKRWGAQQ